MIQVLAIGYLSLYPVILLILVWKIKWKRLPIQRENRIGTEQTTGDGSIAMPVGKERRRQALN